MIPDALWQAIEDGEEHFSAVGAPDLVKRIEYFEYGLWRLENGAIVYAERCGDKWRLYRVWITAEQARAVEHVAWRDPETDPPPLNLTVLGVRSDSTELEPCTRIMNCWTWIRSSYKEAPMKWRLMPRAPV